MRSFNVYCRVAWRLGRTSHPSRLSCCLLFGSPRSLQTKKPPTNILMSRVEMTKIAASRFRRTDTAASRFRRMARLTNMFLHVILSLAILVLPGIGSLWPQLLQGTMATSINVVNNCGVGGPVEFTGHSGITLAPGQSTAPISVPAGYSGRVSFNPLPSTLAEFSIATNNHDTFDISLVDGFNVGLQIAYTGGGCIRNGSPASNTVVCRISISQCPPAYRNGDRCISPNRDVVTDYSSTVKSICPDAYSYSKDDPTSTVTCNPGGDYTVTFCP